MPRLILSEYHRHFSRKDSGRGVKFATHLHTAPRSNPLYEIVGYSFTDDWNYNTLLKET
jgi:hypothetical protein